MNHLMNGYSNIFVTAELTAKKWFGLYRDLLQSDSLDCDDLIQESRLKVLETIRAYPEKNYDQVFKICNKSLTRHMIKLVQKSRLTYSKKTCLNENLFNDNKLDTSDRKLPLHYNEEMIFQYLHTKENRENFNFEELLAVLDEKEYEILKQVIVKGRTLEEAGQKIGCTKQRVDYIMRRALNKAASYLCLETSNPNKKNGYVN